MGTGAAADETDETVRFLFVVDEFGQHVLEESVGVRRGAMISERDD